MACVLIAGVKRHLSGKSVSTAAVTLLSNGELLDTLVCGYL